MQRGSLLKFLLEKQDPQKHLPIQSKPHDTGNLEFHYERQPYYANTAVKQYKELHRDSKRNNQQQNTCY